MSMYIVEKGIKHLQPGQIEKGGQASCRLFCYMHLFLYFGRFGELQGEYGKN